jgi:hypothetical protein
MDESEKAFPMDFYVRDPSPRPSKFRPRRQTFYHRVVGPALEKAGSRGSGSVSFATQARRWPWRQVRTPCWSRSGSAT